MTEKLTLTPIEQQIQALTLESDHWFEQAKIFASKAEHNSGDSRTWSRYMELSDKYLDWAMRLEQQAKELRKKLPRNSQFKNSIRSV